MKIIISPSLLCIFLFINLIPADENKCEFDGSLQDSEEVDDGIKLSLMEGTKFFTEPNSKRRVTLELQNRHYEEITFILTAQESFPVSLDGKTPHVEIVRSVHPSQVLLELNMTHSVYVDLHVPHFVPLGHRVKVTVIATALSSNVSFNYLRKEATFHFLVTNAQTEEINSSPVCLENENYVTECTLDNCKNFNEDNCGNNYWESSFLVYDENLGLDTVSLQNTEDATIKKFWSAPGTTSLETLSVRVSCCSNNVVAKVKNIIGDETICLVGANSSIGLLSMSFNQLLQTLIMFYILL